MAVASEDKPLDTLRDETVDRLIMNYAHGNLSRDAFERRLDAALDAKSHDPLIALTRDLPLQADRDYTAEKQEELGARVDHAPTTNGVDDTEHVINVFAGNSRKGSWLVPRSIRAINIFGGTELDFTEAHFTADTTRITVFCLFGGVDLRVPEGMRTVSKAVALFGGVDNRGSMSADPKAPLLVIEGLVLFGGVSIRVRKTPKERLREFADHLRGMFMAPPPRARARGGGLRKR
jgi:hypothetical protein